MLKRTAVSLMLVFVLVFSFSACGDNAEDTETESVSELSLVYEDGTYGLADEGIDFSYDREYLEKNLPEEYYASYSVTSGNRGNLTKSEITAARSDGKIYFSVDGDETVFVPADGGYLCYTRSKGDDSFTCVNRGFPMDENTVSAYLTIYTNLFGYYYDFNESGSLKSSGTETVAGRSCRKYVYDPSTLGLLKEYKIEFCIDKETGICLSTKYEVSDNSDEYTYDFVCTQFNTKNIPIPEYE